MNLIGPKGLFGSAKHGLKGRSILEKGVWLMWYVFFSHFSQIPLCLSALPLQNSSPLQLLQVFLPKIPIQPFLLSIVSASGVSYHSIIWSYHFLDAVGAAMFFIIIVYCHIDCNLY